MHMQDIETDAADTRVRRAERRDGARLIEMVRALARHHGDEATLTPKALERDLFAPGACASALVAERGGEVVGYAVLAVFTHLHWGRRLMEIHHLFVEEAARGAGIGRHLVAAAVAEARRQECGQLLVSTHPDNGVARQIYGAMGFTEHPSTGCRFKLDLPATGALPAGWI
ncbi:GNAT family N-acetyltransferase [Tropicimonas sediminicola]|uniref:Diamine N-acetyltransferase n=1 Tax=Tropicimonas sediminicola TaxID=1031541 RepID=A0A239H1W3_9RHOB|nr:GNAT family N-acetyltransferase [Tropicimonas sediminicola]SNS75380.1 diamine N-acetyltransferase [Tropicimonas sediminicola]